MTWIETKAFLVYDNWLSKFLLWRNFCEIFAVKKNCILFSFFQQFLLLIKVHHMFKIIVIRYQRLHFLSVGIVNIHKMNFHFTFSIYCADKHEIKIRTILRSQYSRSRLMWSLRARLKVITKLNYNNNQKFLINKLYKMGWRNVITLSRWKH
jgi:hypothetical protein